MKKIIFASIVAVLLTACSDKGKDAAAAFAPKFAQWAQTGQTDSIVAAYPVAEMAQTFTLTPADASDAKVAKSGDGYAITYPSGATVNVVVDEAGNVKIVSSNGLFKFDETKRVFAERIGALKDAETDSALAVAMDMSDAIAAWLLEGEVAKRKNAIRVSGPTITYDPEFALDEGKGYYTLTNTTDASIAANEYTISVVWEAMREGTTSRKIEKSVNLAPGESYKWHFDFNYYYGPNKPVVTMSLPSQEDFIANYQPRGDEYSRYVAEHPQGSASVERLGKGPYELKGKLGGKMAIHMNLHKGMENGSYYYDKYGASHPLSLTVKSFSPRTGKLTLDERNEKGEVTGTFEGTLTPKDYTGTMTSHSGKTYQFHLEVI